MQIEVKNLGKRFNSEWIFKGLNYTFLSGKVYAITGSNGSGKSTLMQVLWGQMPPSLGTITYRKDGKIVPVDEVYAHISIATPYMDLIEEFTLREQLQFHFKIKKCRPGLTIEKMMALMNLARASDKYIANFSSGMKQRLKLALAFFTAADIVFLDEPGTNLDHNAFEWYLTGLRGLPSDCLVFVASNQPAEYPDDSQKIHVLDYK